MILRTKKAPFLSGKHLTLVITGFYNHAASLNTIHALVPRVDSLRHMSEFTGLPEMFPCCVWS